MPIVDFRRHSQCHLKSKACCASCTQELSPVLPEWSCSGNRGFFDTQMEHLTCFVAGNLALGVSSGAVTGQNATRYMNLAKNLAHTCYQMYRHMPTGAVVMLAGNNQCSHL